MTSTSPQIEIFRTALKEARASFDISSKRLSAIESEAARLKKDIAQLRRTITALAAQCSEDPQVDELGITEACSDVMERAWGQLSTQDVVKNLEELGFDLSSQKNVAASVHTILSRMAAKGKIEKVNSNENTPVFWRGPNYAESSDDDIPF